MDKKNILLIAVAALGYYVDAFDLILFGVVRVASLTGLGFTGDDILSKGQMLFNYQMIGMLIGGILWGVLGDKKGRRSVLFASIIIYSLGNILNSFVTDINTYAWLRFITGIGLAGELGVGVTLVSESLPTSKRGYGPTIIAVFGALGALSAPLMYKLCNNFLAQYWEAWRLAYLIGGVLGLVLLLLRIGVMESTLYTAMDQHQNRGNFFQLFTSISKFKRFIFSILLGLPIWYIISILALIAPEMAKALQVVGEVNSGSAIFYMYSGLALGDFACGLISQYMKSRKRPIYLYLIMALVVVFLYLNSYGVSAGLFYGIIFFLGCVGGYWALFITVSAEQFGTNLRATVATSVPNFVRGAVVLINMGLLFLAKNYGLIQAAMVVGVVCFMLAFIANYVLEETFYRDMDFLEE